ncbi:hypothetical protein [Streptomyces sp. NPDC019224]|uniref:hypothetical protein n=1 Tax=Streptomyces sp. NPDC019224 TaxID=3154484 RepID=UPI0033F72079
MNTNEQHRSGHVVIGIVAEIDVDTATEPLPGLAGHEPAPPVEEFTAAVQRVLSSRRS